MRTLTTSKEYREDWLSMPARHKSPDLSELADSAIHILPGEKALTYAIYSSMKMAQKSKGISFDINITKKGDTFFSADYIIDPGFCMTDTDKLSSSIEDRIDMCLSYIYKAAPKRVILLSDYRFFQGMYSDQKTSENEYHHDIYHNAVNNLSKTAQYELRMQAALSDSDIDYIILRTAYLYAPGLQVSGNFLHHVAKDVANEQVIHFCHNQKKYAFCYMGDFLSSIFWAILKCPINQVYHVVSTEAFSLEDLAAVLYDQFPNYTHIEFISDELFEQSFSDRNIFLPGNAMAGAKLQLYGYKPLMTIEQGISLLIKSYHPKETSLCHIYSYDGKLFTVKKILLQMLLEVDRICKKYQIQYFLAGGTLLGAVRHGGFIPWDDDIDIMMTRDQYNKFNAVVEQELPDDMFFQTPTTDKNSHYLFDKIRLNGTLLMTDFAAQFPDMHNGIFLDVVVQDRTSSQKIGRKIHIWTTHQLRKMAMNKWKNLYTTDCKAGIRRIYQKGKNFITKKISFSALEKTRYRVLTHYSSKPTGWLYDGMGRNIEKGAFPEIWLDEAVELKFEEHLFPVPKEYDAYLTYLYGDYRQLPPVSQREISHEMSMIDLGEYYDF